MTAAISATELTRRFRDFVAVDAVSFEVEAGTTFGFLGPNGAGKTTTVRMLCTLALPSAGSARVAGFDVVRERGDVRRHIGIIFQDPSLDDRLTARENLRFAARLYHIPNAEITRRIDTALEWMELTDRGDSLVREFSGGMKRRLEIARGLMHAPGVLFLDEPTLGLDPQTRGRIWEHLRRLKRERGTTLFMTTHYMDEAEYCDRIAVIDHGKIIALDTPAALKSAVRGDLVELATADDAAATAEVKQRWGLEAKPVDAGLCVEVSEGASFLPRLLKDLSVPVLRVDLRRPTLDDVFLKLTGRQIRDSAASSSDKTRSRLRRVGRGWR
jgi:ABC-2 type transport system ATP-binding protein